MNRAIAGALRGITWEHARGHGSVARAAAAYAERTGVRVEFQARSLQSFADQPLERLVDDHDLLIIDHPHIPMAAERGLLLALDGRGHGAELAELAAHSVGASHASYAHAGHQWALANDAAAQVAAYRPDLLGEPPQDFDGVLELARAGRVVWPAKPIDAFSSLMTRAAHRLAHVGQVSDAFFPDDVMEQAMSDLHRLAELIDPACLAMNPIEVADRLAGDDDTAYAPLLFGYTNYSRDGFRRHQLRYTDIASGPHGPVGSLLGGAGIAVSARTRRPKAAVDFAFWVAGAEAQRGPYFDGGGQPGHAAAWDDPALDAQTLGFFSGTRRTLEGACVRPRHPGFCTFQDEVSPLVTSALRGELTDTALISRITQVRERHLGDEPSEERR